MPAVAGVTFRRSGADNNQLPSATLLLLYILGYLGGVLTILSPCILPVLPFVFARADRPFLTNGLPMLIGMALMFMIVASLAAVGGGWAVEANQYGRAIALALLAVLGLTLLLPAFADRLMRPLVAFGARLSQRADVQGSGFRVQGSGHPFSWE
jgi:cytochrome c biogenesis protein CcdA